MVVRKSDAPIRTIADNKIETKYITKDISEKISLTVIEVTDYDEKETTDYNCIYYVFDGALRLKISDKETALHKGDAVFIGKGMSYEMKGTFKAIFVNQPPFSL